MSTDTWDPAQYERFERERSAPFFDLLDLVKPCPGGRVVDLGCGTGELTRALHERTRAGSTVGLDSSPAMLKRSADHTGDGLTFELGDIAEWAPSRPVDLIFSNAALHWIDHHDVLFTRLTGALSRGGQLAVQVPANHDHPSHLVAERVATEEPFRAALGGYLRRTPVLAPERYARLLHRLGYGTQHVRLQVYLHLLPEPGAIVDWVKGTLLTDYRRRLPDRVYEDFVARYRELLVSELPDERPFPFSFKRVLLWGSSTSIAEAARRSLQERTSAALFSRLLGQCRRSRLRSAASSGRASSRAGVSWVRAETPASVGRELPAVRALRVGCRSDSSEAAGGVARRVGRASAHPPAAASADSATGTAVAALVADVGASQGSRMVMGTTAFRQRP